jgi:hypothetical protein
VIDVEFVDILIKECLEKVTDTMKSMKGFIGIIVVISFVLMFVSSSCVFRNVVNQSQDVKTVVISETPIKIYWVEEHGWLQTNDYERLQKTLPFSLILPKYIPVELKQYPPKFKKSSNTIETITETALIEEEVVEVGIIYEAFSGNFRTVNITENDSAYPWPEYDQYQFWDFNGVTIQEYTFISANLSSEDKKEEEFTRYMWYWHNLRIEAKFRGYNQEDSRKIVASMFE